MRPIGNTVSHGALRCQHVSRQPGAGCRLQPPVGRAVASTPLVHRHRFGFGGLQLATSAFPRHAQVHGAPDGRLASLLPR